LLRAGVTNFAGAGGGNCFLSALNAARLSSTRLKRERLERQKKLRGDMPKL
jgi:hypothetical protein